MYHLLQQWLGSLRRGRPIRKASAAARRHLGLESLEGRLVPAVSVGVDQGVWLNIVGSGDNENVTVSRKTQGTATTADDVLVVKVSINGGSPTSQSFALSSIKSIHFDLGAGNDVFTNNTDLMSTGHGGAGNDPLRGGSAPDTMFGDDGTDVRARRDGR